MNAYNELEKGIKWVIDNCTSYQVAKDLGINNRTINRYQNGETPLENMSMKTAKLIYNYYEEMDEMKRVYNEIMNRWKENDKVFVSYFENVNEILNDGMDKEVLDEEYYVFGNPNAVPSELEESFIIIEVSGATDTPIFTSDSKEEVLHYLEDNHSEYIKEGN